VTARAATRTATHICSMLEQLVVELLDFYRDLDEDLHGGPGLLVRLDTVALRTSQPSEEGGSHAPGSRPPASLAAVHWSTRIKADAIALDAELRASPYRQSWDKALRALPAAADLAGRSKDITRTVGMWHSTARTVLGLQRPALHFPHVRCLQCGERSIYGRANAYAPRAWCTNVDCRDVDPDTGEPTDKPPRYEGSRLYLLTQRQSCRSSR
jgi:hypothetical protein